MTLTLRQESKINEAHLAGVKLKRIAELIGCTEQEVLATLEIFRRLKADRDEWDAVLEAEKNGRQMGKIL